MLDYLIMLLSPVQPRRVRVIENILHNKRTVTTLFWGMRYQILPWLGSNKQLNRTAFDAAVNQLINAGLVQVDQSQILLTNTGVQGQLKFEQEHYQPQFQRFYLLADLSKIEQRVLLAGQVLSEYSYHNKKYAPMSFDDDELQAVKQWFHQQDKRAIVHDFKLELQTFLATLTTQQADFISAQLVGHENAGWSIEQLAKQMNMPTSDVSMLNYDLWAAFTGFFSESAGVIHNLLAPLIKPSPLSHSTQATYELYRQQQSIEQISRYRRLKPSTIREHLLEVAIFLPKQFPFQQLIPATILDQMKQQYTGNIDHWQFTSQGKDDGQLFFYFRLFQIMRSYCNND